MGTTPSGERFTSGARVGDYVIDKQVGDAYEAIHVVLPRRVRLAVLPATAASPDVSTVRMLREACILEALRHPGVPRIYEVGVLVEAGRHRPWIASEIVAGVSLLDATLDRGRLPIHEVLALLREVGEILAYAHARGVVHRGVRPDAILRGDSTRGYPLCLVNWADARASDGADEQDRASADDVFALGLVADLVLASRAAAPPRLAALIDDMLSPNPSARPWAAEVAVRAKLMLEGLDDPSDELIAEENVVLVDISRTTTVRTQPPSRPRVRWTPQIGMSPTPARQGVAIGVIKPRT